MVKSKGQNYFVIIGDMVRSRALTNRSQVQEAFKAALKKVQQEFKGQVISPFTLTIGDEFQAVLKKADHFFRMVASIEQQLPQVNFRFGLGVGEINTEINQQAAIGMDGPAFHAARDALEEARLQKRRFVFRCYPDLARERIDLLFRWVDVIMSGWSPEKRLILEMAEQGLTQKSIAKAVKISQPAVSQHLRQPVFRLVGESRKVIQNEINALLEARL